MVGPPCVARPTKSSCRLPRSRGRKGRSTCPWSRGMRHRNLPQKRRHRRRRCAVEGRARPARSSCPSFASSHAPQGGAADAGRVSRGPPESVMSATSVTSSTCATSGRPTLRSRPRRTGNRPTRRSALLASSACALGGITMNFGRTLRGGGASGGATDSRERVMLGTAWIDRPVDTQGCAPCFHVLLSAAWKRGHAQANDRHSSRVFAMPPRGFARTTRNG